MTESFILQGMMGLPIVLFFLFAFVLMITLIVRAVIRAFRKSEDSATTNWLREIFIGAVLALLVCAWFVYKLWTFDGPWIN